MVASIIALISAIFQSIPIFAKWFPPKTAEQSTESAETLVQDEMNKIETDGRP